MKKKLLSLALVLAFCLGLAAPASASEAGTTKTVTDELHGITITMDGFLREETRIYHCIQDGFDLYEQITICVVADASNVTIEAMEGRSYVTSDEDYDRLYDSLNESDGGDSGGYAYLNGVVYPWNSETASFGSLGSGSMPLEQTETYTAVPSEAQIMIPRYSFLVSWLCESDYAKLVPATINASGWAQAEMEEAWNRGLIAADYFTEDCTRGMTRAEFAIITVRLYSYLINEAIGDLGVSPEHPFTDADPGFVGLAYNLGFVKGVNTAGTLFDPEGTLTRQEAAVMLSRVYAKAYSDIPTVSSTGFADDGDIADWAKSEVAFMADREFVKGVGSNKFAPKSTLAIQEAVIMAYRMLEKLS